MRRPRFRAALAACGTRCRGFFLVKRSVIDGAQLKPSGYKILLEVLAHSPNARVEEAPYVFEERTSGGSKMGAGQIGIYLLQLVRLAAVTGELPRAAGSLLVEPVTLLLNVYLWLWLYEAGDLGIPVAAGIAAVAAAGVRLLLRAAVSTTLGRGAERRLRVGKPTLGGSSLGGCSRKRLSCLVKLHLVGAWSGRSGAVGPS